VTGLQSLMAAQGLEASYYGHAAAGLLHVRPVLDLHSAADLQKLREVSNEVSALVSQFKGSLAGVWHGPPAELIDWLRRRMTRLVHRGEAGATSFRPSITLVDISNWFTVDYVYIRDLVNGKKVITDERQVKL
jgi:hypothetical protein